MSFLVFILGIVIGYTLRLIPEIDAYIRRRLKEDY